MDRVRCSKCKAPFVNPMQHTGVCDNIIDNKFCYGLAERYQEEKHEPSTPAPERAGRNAG